MKTHDTKAHDDRLQTAANTPAGKQHGDHFTAPFVDARPEAITQRKLQSMVNHHSAQQPGLQTGVPDSMVSKTAQREVIQKQLIDKINVYVDGGGYPVWTQEGIDWHMTMKDSKRWHITKSDRSMSYWFEVDGGTVTSVAPKRDEYGSHRAKHKSLDEAPGDVPKFVKNNISAIIKVTDKEP